MKVSLSWLNEYVAIDMPLDQLVYQLTMTGLEVEAVEDRYAYLDTVVVGRVTEVGPHPHADKLKVCRVQAGPHIYQVVCGAPNVAEGLMAPLALAGSRLSGGTVVKANAIRGETSEGMLCSQAELGLGADSAGLMALPGDLSPGEPLNKALGLRDHVLEIGLTPNRADCLSIIGIAREVAGFKGGALQRPAVQTPQAGGTIAKMTSVTIEAPDHCPRYTARLVENITVGPSPFWLADRLISVGLRPINNIVDITNYIMLETGQPLHAFDFDRLAENRIVVRTARQDERFTTLDGKERSLGTEMLMICDGCKPVGIGGVMGGLNSEIESGTTRVLLESAYFNPVSIRKTAKQLGIKSDASHRFERGVDPHGTLFALERASQLMAELGQGQLVEGCIDVAVNLPQPPTLRLSAAATHRLLGTRMERDEMAQLLSAIGFNVQPEDEDTLRVATPSFRVDISRPEDLMEEVARRAGYDRIPVTYPALPAVTRPASQLWTKRQSIRFLLAGLGFAEIITYSFVPEDSCRRLRLPGEDPRCRQLAVLNPLSEDQAVMRTSLVPGLLDTMKRNLSRQSRNLKLFETGKIFISKGSDQQPEEIEMLSGLWSGDRCEPEWHTKPEACDFYDLKGALESLLDGLRISAVRFTGLPDDLCTYTQPGSSAQIIAEGEVLGVIGAVHPQVLAAYELRQKAFVFEINLERLVIHIPETRRSRPLPKYPAVGRDATLIVSKDLEAEALLDYIHAMDEPLVEEVRLFDVYAGPPIPDGRKSISLRIVYRSPETTLEDAAVNAIHKDLSDRLVKAFNADLPA
ncbi:MAG: phenylalanine--tRNA ligase subunit beta [Desulfobacteraceae bacterium]|nr:MAG: phenylalanine--tRNA ligase subunit beta [Desulfobacteraceae bacterium]